MSQEITTVEQLKKLGFQEMTGDDLDDGGYYEWYCLSLNKICLYCTIEYDKYDMPGNLYFEIGDERLQGRPLTISDVELLKEII